MRRPLLPVSAALVASLVASLTGCAVTYPSTYVPEPIRTVSGSTPSATEAPDEAKASSSSVFVELPTDGSGVLDLSGFHQSIQEFHVSMPVGSSFTVISRVGYIDDFQGRGFDLTLSADHSSVVVHVTAATGSIFSDNNVAEIINSPKEG